MRYGIVSVKNIRGVDKFIITDIDDKFESYPFDSEDVKERDIVKYSRLQIDYKKRKFNCGANITVEANISNYEIDFINPYNFVRVEKPKVGDRFSYSKNFEKYHEKTYTGKLHCTLKNISQLFIPDTTTKKEDSGENSIKDHWHYEFLKQDGKPIIPATSIKGMVRCVFETITNSCFSQFSQEIERVSFRGKPLVPKAGIILSLPDDTNNGEILECEDAWVDKYNFRNNHYHSFTVDKIPDGIYNGDAVEFNYENTRHRYRKFPIRHAKDYNATSFSSKGFIKMTGKNFFKKHDERIFYHEVFNTQPELKRVKNSNEIAEAILNKPSLKSLKDVNIIVYNLLEKQKYDSIQKKQLDSDKAYLCSNSPSSGDGRTAYYHKELQVGDLIYFEENGRNAINISYVSVPKKAFNKNPYDLLREFSPALLPCHNIAKLCPACNIFGATDLQNGDKKVSIAGKVRFTNAISDRVYNDSDYKICTLKILGSPHDTATNFYLIDYDNSNSQYDNSDVVQKTEGQGYDKNPIPVLRGRKFYWHHCDENTPLNKSHYDNGTDKSNQNATVQLLKEDAEFSFDVFYENLTEKELMYLIWSLQLEKGMYHKLGHGKPLGLGSVNITINKDESYYLDLHNYYTDIKSDGKKNIDFENLEKLFDTDSVKSSINYQDLIKILKPLPAIFKELKYPKAVAIKGKNTGESLGFEWFMNNNEQQLKTIEEIVNNNEKQSKYSNLKEKP